MTLVKHELMGSFTEAFGMDRLSFGTLIRFYAVEDHSYEYYYLWHFCGLGIAAMMYFLHPV